MTHKKKVSGKDKSSKIYKNLWYYIEKKLTVKNANPKVMKDLSLNGIICYIIRDTVYDYGFLYFTTRDLGENTYLSGEQLLFIKSTLTNQFNLIIRHNSLGQKILKKAHKKDMDENILVTPNMIINPNNESQNKHSIHLKRVVLDREDWYLEELRKLNIKSYRKKALKSLLNNDTVIDSRLKKVLISEFFIITDNKYMQNESHSIVLTQGGTGKSSILGVMGKSLDTNSPAGLFGYYNVKSNSWVSGEVDKTDKPMVIDETNEMILKNEYVLETLNTPLDNGRYTYGKAGGRTINFGNQFIILGNVTEDFNFGQFITGLATNPHTVGRRFAYIIYDNKIEFKNSKTTRIKTPDRYLNLFTHACSHILRYFLDIREFEKLLKSEKLEEIKRPYEEKIMKKIKSIEHEYVRNFFKEYTKSLRDRLPMLALKLVIFDNIDYLIGEDISGMEKYELAQQLYTKYEELLEDSLDSFESIKAHLEQNPISQGVDEKVKQDLSKEPSNYILNVLECISLHGEFNNNRIYYVDLNLSRNDPKKRKFHCFLQNLKRENFRQNSKLNKYGIQAKLDNNNNVFITITNPHMFEKIQSYFKSSEINNETSNKEEKNVENETKTNTSEEELDQIDMQDL